MPCWGQLAAAIQESDWMIGNVDITILAQSPRMAPHIDAMCQRLSSLMNISAQQVNVKASTTEGMGFVGRKEGIETYAVVLIYRDK